MFLILNCGPVPKRKLRRAVQTVDAYTIKSLLITARDKFVEQNLTII